jgi:GNAT superfamily N-acetyltransferase
MQVLEAERPAADVAFKRWSSDLHHPEAVMWSDREQVHAVLQSRGADGTVVFGVDDPRRLEHIHDGRRLAVVFRADHPRFRKGDAVPVFATDYVVDRDRGIVAARFGIDRAAGRQRALPTPIAASLECSILFERRQPISIVGLSPYEGVFLTDDPGRCLTPGMTVCIDFWVPWAGARRLHAQVTGCRDEAGPNRFAFRVVDRKSAASAAIVLAGTVDDFGLDALKAAGVRQGRITKYLTVQTVADRSTFREALELRLLGNRKYGRLAGVHDETMMADHLDPHSINFLCRLGDKPLGTGRVVVNGGDRALSEIESETEGLPGWIWDGGFVEVSRFAIHPDFGGAGVTLALFREVARLAFNVDCRYLVLDAIERLVPIYERIGAKRLPLTKIHPYSQETVHVMVVDIGEQLSQLDRRFLYWQFVFGPVLRHQTTTAAPASLTTRCGGGANIPFWLKRKLSRVI